MARRHGQVWYLGALTDRNARDIPVRLDFLGSGEWTMRLWKDSADSGRYAQHLDTEERTVSAADALTLHLAPGGGTVASFEKITEN